MNARFSRLPLLAGYATVAAMLPYLSIKVAWLAGSDLGLAEPGLMRTTPFVVGNLLTALMEVVGAALALVLVHRWGHRLPAWLVLFPMWVATGLLTPVMLAAPLGFVLEVLAGAGRSGSGEDPVSGLEGWVYAVVYSGFILQGIGLALAFAIHLRTRWSDVLRSPLRRAGATHEVQVMATVAVGALTALVVAVRLYWAFGGEAGLPNTSAADGRLAQQALDASSAVLALAGLLGLIVLVAGQPRTVRTWMPLAAVWIGSGSMLCSGAYQLVILLAPGTPFEASGGGGFGLVLVAQLLAGLLCAVTGTFHLAENNSSLCPRGKVFTGAHAGDRG
ncbi:hypothetical protein GCM10009789_29260 [Kribbella sancticallisti]|uniref:Uncharacterized protein n=1 Tax=Kribbella sancticallisti TaxID=460087 RepID=A0ABN2DDA1_9ACTN